MRVGDLPFGWDDEVGGRSEDDVRVKECDEEGGGVVASEPESSALRSSRRFCFLWGEQQGRTSRREHSKGRDVEY